MGRFDELLIRCDEPETPELTLSRFRNGLRPDIKRELLSYYNETLEQTFQQALEIESWLRP